MKEFHPHFIPCSDCQTIGFQGYHRAGEGEKGIGQVKMPQSSLFLPTFGDFFLNKHFPDYCKPFVNLQILTVFARFVILYRERIFGGPCSIFAVTPSQFNYPLSLAILSGNLQLTWGNQGTDTL